MKLSQQNRLSVNCSKMEAFFEIFIFDEVIAILVLVSGIFLQ